jgi:peptidoglycan L-alanyl-D-glutamate endopeptidase CwlK
VNRFSKKSSDQLKTCHPDLQRLFEEVLKICDCSILEGYRTPEDQFIKFNLGRSKVKHGKHNFKPSLAVDVAPYPIDWENIEAFYYFGGLVKGLAHSLNIKICWGGDWDGDNDLKDQTFNDLVHFEIEE